MTNIRPAPVAVAPALPPRVYASRLPRDLPPSGPDGRPATRWRDPHVAAAYAERDDEAERAALWPLLADAVRPERSRRVSGRPDGTVLDLGCGLGGLAQYLADRHWLRVYAFDISPAIHRIGAKRFRDAWVVRTLPDTHHRIPLRRAQCTAAIAQRLLLHMAHPCLIVGLLTDARRVLRRGAPLAVVERDTRSAPEAVCARTAHPETALRETALHETASPETPATETVPGNAPQPANAPNRSEGEPYIEHYRLRDGSALPATAWWYSPATIAGCMAAAGFQVEQIQVLSCCDRPLMYRARAV